MKLKAIFWIFIAASAANLIAQIIPSAELNRFTKPLLMPLLLYFVYESSRGKVTLRILLLSLAIFLSWLGDVALLYGDQQGYFLLGLGLFLLAQVTYIIVLYKSSYQAPQFDVLKVLPFVIYAVGLFKLLLPEAGDLLIPIAVYGIIISVMACVARLREGNTTQESYRLALYGSILFVISDSVLAINKFYTEIPMAGLWIMSTYLGAQLLLAKGVIGHVE